MLCLRWAGNRYDTDTPSIIGEKQSLKSPIIFHFSATKLLSCIDGLLWRDNPVTNKYGVGKRGGNNWIVILLTFSRNIEA